MKMIEVQDLKKFYGDYAALSGITFSIDSGEIVGLLGLNGAGKSTILKILSCSLLPSAGHARINGHSVEEQPDDVRRLIGFLPDSPPLYEEMSVDSYLKFVAKLKGIRCAKLEAAVDAAMQKTNLADERRTLIRELSHGFRQRVGIAGAIVHDPKVLIFDEPINGLDPVQIVEMRDLVRSLGGNYTVILSSHILSEITKTCDRILIIDNGQLVAEGSQDQIQKSAGQRMLIQCEVGRITDEIRAMLKSHPGVTGFREGTSEAGLPLLEVETDGDLRAEISTMIVNAQLGLLSMGKDRIGLEKVFMQLVRSSDRVRSEKGRTA